jgi:pimeloyl-ACP methyl ester carboxylesterase
MSSKPSNTNTEDADDQAQDPRMQHVTSADGTRIAFRATGSGPALLLVHGTASDHTAWRSVAGLLATRFTVYAMDRRGRGGSGDAGAYRIEREYEDVAAVIRSIGAEVDVVAHCYGAACALGAASGTPQVRRLVLYEPRVPTDGSVVPEAVLADARARLARGDREGVLVAFLRDVAGLPPRAVDAMLQSREWIGGISTAHTVVREMELERWYRFQPDQYGRFTIPTLLLTGSESPSFLRLTAARMHAALPASRLVVLAGQGHTAMTTAPQRLAEELTAFLA